MGRGCFVSEADSFGHNKVTGLMVFHENQVWVLLYGRFEGIEPLMGPVFHGESIHHGNSVVPGVGELPVDSSLLMADQISIEDLGYATVASEHADGCRSKAKHYTHPTFSNICPAKVAI